MLEALLSQMTGQVSAPPHPTSPEVVSTRAMASPPRPMGCRARRGHPHPCRTPRAVPSQVKQKYMSEPQTASTAGRRWVHT